MNRFDFQIVMSAFYKEIKDKKGSLGEPNVVLYLNGAENVTFNPRKDMKVTKNAVITNGNTIEFSKIRGVNFYFDKEDSNIAGTSLNVNKVSKLSYKFECNK